MLANNLRSPLFYIGSTILLQFKGADVGVVFTRVILCIKGTTSEHKLNTSIRHHFLQSVINHNDFSTSSVNCPPCAWDCQSFFMMFL